MLLSFEGIDRSGKTTTIAAVERYFKDNGIDFVTYAFPYFRSDIGRVIKNAEFESPMQMQLAFAANFWDLQERILAHKKAGTHVLLDRYIHSSVAYGMSRGLVRSTCESMLDGLLSPDIVVFLDADPKKAASRGGISPVDCDIEFQTRVQNAYYDVFDRLDNVYAFDSNKSKRSLHRSVISFLDLP